MLKKFIHEFKEFALKGNVMDLAVGVIIGAAFQSIVTALTRSFINPLIAVCTGGANGEGVTVGGTFVVRGVTFDYGAFITAVINFLIMAFVLFLMVKAMNKMMSLEKKKEEINQMEKSIEEKKEEEKTIELSIEKKNEELKNLEEEEKIVQ